MDTQQETAGAPKREVRPIPDLRTPQQKYEQKVDTLIRQRYSASEEFALLRQKDSKPDEYAEYYAWCEECKRKAKREFAR